VHLGTRVLQDQRDLQVSVVTLEVLGKLVFLASQANPVLQVLLVFLVPWAKREAEDVGDRRATEEKWDFRAERVTKARKGR